MRSMSLLHGRASPVARTSQGAWQRHSLRHRPCRWITQGKRHNWKLALHRLCLDQGLLAEMPARDLSAGARGTATLAREGLQRWRAGLSGCATEPRCR